VVDAVDSKFQVLPVQWMRSQLYQDKQQVQNQICFHPEPLCFVWFNLLEETVKIEPTGFWPGCG
jgi:hypothetical protein